MVKESEWPCAQARQIQHQCGSRNGLRNSPAKQAVLCRAARALRAVDCQQPLRVQLALTKLRLCHHERYRWRWLDPDRAGTAHVAVSVEVTLANVGTGGLTTDVYPTNWAALHGRCNGSSMYPGTCGWGSIQLGSGSWVNASVAASGARQLTLTAEVPAESSGGRPTATAYAWAPVPLMNAYDKSSGLPVLPWNRSII